VLDVYRLWRPSPLFRAHRLEQALGTPARIYYKYEGVSPGRLAQAQHRGAAGLLQRQGRGVTKLTTETGAGQWGTALAFACAQFGLECEVWQVGASYDGKPYRRLMIETFGATVHPPRPTSPRPAGSCSREDPDHPARSASPSPRRSRSPRRIPTTATRSAVLNHVLLHQTIIGEEALLQLAKAGRDTPTCIVGCTGGGSNFGGLSLPVPAREAGREDEPGDPRGRAGQCPSLTQGVYAYDFGDTAGMTPLMKMHTLGPRLHPRPDPRRRPALPRHGPLISHIYERG
jgi:tryptophan synthase beta chain